MKKMTNFIDSLYKKYFSSDKQLTRIVILVGVVLVLAVGSFAGYYWFDRYYRAQPTTKQLSISQAEKAMRDKPNDPAIRMALAETYLNNNRLDDAVTQALQVKQAAPDNVMPDFVIGMAYANSGKCPDALSPLQSFIDKRKGEDMPGLDRSLQAASYYLGDCYLQLGKPQDAIQPLEATVNWARTDADAMYKLGLAYAATNDHAKAINMFVGATAFVPSYTEAYVGMAASYDAIKNPARANYARGMLAFTQKDYKTALQLLLQAAQADPGFAPIFTGLGMTYEAMNDLPNARASYAAALKIDPNNFSAENGVQRVDALLKK